MSFLSGRNLPTHSGAQREQHGASLIGAEPVGLNLGSCRVGKPEAGLAKFSFQTHCLDLPPAQGEGEGSGDQRMRSLSSGAWSVTALPSMEMRWGQPMFSHLTEVDLGQSGPASPTVGGAGMTCTLSQPGRDGQSPTTSGAAVDASQPWRSFKALPQTQRRC